VNTFSIEARRIPGSVADNDPQSIVIRLGETVFTQLLRPGQDKLDDALQAPASQLAFWLVDNWWRLRFECVRPTRASAQWRLAHDMTSIGGGFPWPRLRIWGEGPRVGLASKSDREGVVSPVRYMTDALFFILGKDFESAVDQFLAMVADEKSGYGPDRGALLNLLNILRAERADPEIAQWRRVEAQLGFDPDQAPESLVREVGRFSERYGIEGIEEAVQAHPGIEAAKVLSHEIRVAETNGWDCDFTKALRSVGKVCHDYTLPPWRTAQEVAQRLRKAIGISSGLVQNKVLAEVAEIDPRALESTTLGGGRGLEYGLRLKPEKPRSRLVFHYKAETSRRFELGRAIGDVIWGEDSVGPLASSKTARQKFQRAFAQSLLCPFDELMAVLDTSHPTDDDISDAAQRFNVSERVVRTTLMNNNVIEREFQDQIEAA
jgi:hypothetical protein